MSEINYVHIGKRLRLFREERGYSQNRLAIKAHLNWETIRRCEAGKSAMNLTTAIKICDALNLSLDEFVGR